MGVAEAGLAAIAVAQKENEIRDSGYLGAIVVSDIGSAKDMLADPAQPSSIIKLASLAYGIKTVYPEFRALGCSDRNRAWRSTTQMSRPARTSAQFPSHP